MHDIRWIRENAAEYDRALTAARSNAESKKLFSIADLLAIDERRRSAIQKFEQAQARRQRSLEGSRAGQGEEGRGRGADADGEVNELQDHAAGAGGGDQAAEAELNKLLATIPNLPLTEVPDGIDEHGNVSITSSAPSANYTFTPKQHFELGEALGLMDFETAAKLSGARFVVLKGGLARLERAARAVDARCAHR